MPIFTFHFAAADAPTKNALALGVAASEDWSVVTGQSDSNVGFLTAQGAGSWLLDVASAISATSDEVTDLHNLLGI